MPDYSRAELLLIRAVILILACVVLMAATSAMAGSTRVESTSVVLKRGTTNVAQTETASACEAEKTARILAEAETRTSGTATYSCVVTAKTVVTFNPDRFGNALVTWSAPTHCVDGRTISACPVTGYRLRYGQAELTNEVVLLATATSHTLNQLVPGTWRFALISMSAIDGPLSAVATKTIQ